MHEPIVGNIDFAQVALYAFWVFFAGLIYYLQTENMREGYPLEDDDGKASSNPGLFPLPRPKTFRLPHGRGEVTVPNSTPERDVALRRTNAANGYPLEPIGDPMIDGVGPAAWAARRDVPELDGKGHPKIVPLSGAADFVVSAGRDPRGMPVVAGDKAIAGVISDLWIDEPEQMVRYLEVDLEGGAGKRLIPLPLARIRGDRVTVHSIYAGQFAGVPMTKSRNQVTKLEEEKICAYYCGGKLYASEDRQQPFL